MNLSRKSSLGLNKEINVVGMIAPMVVKGHVHLDVVINLDGEVSCIVNRDIITSNNHRSRSSPLHHNLRIYNDIFGGNEDLIVPQLDPKTAQ